MKKAITLAFLASVSLSSIAAVQPLSGLTQGNATVFDGARYATPAGCCAGPGTNPPATGPGEARLDPWAYGNGSGFAISFLGAGAVAPYASAQASLATGPRNPAGQGIDAYAYTYYAFEVFGDPSMTGQLTKIDVTDAGTTTGTGDNGYTTASVILDDFNVGSGDPARRRYTRQASTSCTYGVCTIANNFADVAENIYVPINHIIGVYLNASANSQVPFGSIQAPGTFSAMIDPIFALDALAPSGLTLVFSPGIHQPSSVPEPMSLALFVVGLGVLGLLRGSRNSIAQRAWLPLTAKGCV